MSSTTPRNTLPRAQQPGGDRALQRLRRARVGEPRGEHGRRQPVVGERDEHGVEHPAPRPASGMRRCTSRNASSVNVTLAHQLGGQVAAHQRDRVGVGAPDAGAQPVLIAHAREVDLLVVALARQLVLGHAAGRGVRELVDRLEVARHLEWGQALRGPVADRRPARRRRSTTNALTSSSESSEGTPTTAASLDRRDGTPAPPRPRPGARFSPRRRMISFSRPDERVRAVVVLVHEVAGPQPAAGEQHALGLLGHAPVAAASRRGCAAGARRPRPRGDGLALADHARVVDVAEPRVLARRAERAVRAASPCGQIIP